MSITTKKSDGTVTTKFTGCVLETFIREERVMSDVYANVKRATVYNVETDAFETVYVRAYFECDSGETDAEVDAIQEIKDLYEAHKLVQETEAKLNDAKRFRAQQLDALKTPKPGRPVKVVKGRKVPKGTVGECMRVQDFDFGRRVQIRTLDGQLHWTAITNCEAVI
jgi:hypothetical protein